MSANDYLAKVLAAQTPGDDSEELKAFQKHRAGVEKVLRDRFEGCSPTIRYGGSKAKGNIDDYLCAHSLARDRGCSGARLERPERSLADPGTFAIK